MSKKKAIKWTARLDRNFSYITAPNDGGLLPPIVARDLTEEHCALIVHAVNSYASLCQVLERAIGDGLGDGLGDNWKNDARAALALAKEGNSDDRNSQ